MQCKKDIPKISECPLGVWGLLSPYDFAQSDGVGYGNYCSVGSVVGSESVCFKPLSVTAVPCHLPRVGGNEALLMGELSSKMTERVIQSQLLLL